MPESVNRRGSSGPTIGAMVGLSGRVATRPNTLLSLVAWQPRLAGARQDPLAAGRLARPIRRGHPEAPAGVRAAPVAVVFVGVGCDANHPGQEDKGGNEDGYTSHTESLRSQGARDHGASGRERTAL